MAQKVNVLICGSGSAGLCAGLWLSRYGIPCTILDSRSEAMKMGQADGVQCRTVEVFDSFGLAEELLREAYHVLEDTFWADDGHGRIVRTRSTFDTEPGLSIHPHVILNQARVNGMMIEAMGKLGQGISYGYLVKSVAVDREKVDEENSYPITVVTEKDGKEEIFRANYVLGCDGAHSAVRRSLGFQMIGDSTDSVWGVMDIYPLTNFPDIRKKSIIHSSSGTILIIPREGGSLCRFYIQLPPGTNAKSVALEDLYRRARDIFSPYEMDFAGNFWWSAYSIGQRLADRFEESNRVFLLGDACHTHSPKAGQGMNTSLQDGYNIGWKLGSILSGLSPPSLLQTYVSERHKVAHELITFDQNLTSILSSSSSPSSPTPTTKDAPQTNGTSKSEKFTEMFLQSARYTAGLTASYNESVVVKVTAGQKSLASKVDVGMRFASTQVVRWCDAKAMQIVKALPADGRWRIVVLGGDICSERSRERLHALTRYLSSPESPISIHTPAGKDIDSFIETLLVLSGSRLEVEQDQIPSFFFPVSGKWGMKDLHKVFFDDESYNSGHGHAYDFYGTDPNEGAVIIVRPDQYVSMVTSLDDHAGLGKFFAGFSLKQR
ncbi:hypothetical protein BP6252_06378 [Coleophoma cylindrospora]|uniref:Phenol 2-monooxygenase n=1 Tax=Coleophoma cylindrospora TaxID=1849047 RepID=A0A3D8RMS3_9HELO|nr:hypothetical protein BP6252_06378 [Coleophoma cylindrospora]